MPSHYWGDDWFKEHGEDLNDAISYCMDFWRRWGRIGSHGKEKYGTFRDHVYFYRGWWAIHELVNPGYVSYWWPKWFYPIDLFLGRVVRFLRLYKPMQWYQAQIYNYAIQRACKKYPNIIDELVADLDGYELVKPGIFGPVSGEEINKKYWVRYDNEKEEI
jgi:hypothetical protein